jgi:hypothetical protein
MMVKKRVKKKRATKTTVLMPWPMTERAKGKEADLLAEVFYLFSNPRYLAVLIAGIPGGKNKKIRKLRPLTEIDAQDARTDDESEDEVRFFTLVIANF